MKTLHLAIVSKFQDDNLLLLSRQSDIYQAAVLCQTNHHCREDTNDLLEATYTQLGAAVGRSLMIHAKNIRFVDYFFIGGDTYIFYMVCLPFESINVDAINADKLVWVSRRELCCLTRITPQAKSLLNDTFEHVYLTS